MTYAEITVPSAANLSIPSAASANPYYEGSMIPSVISDGLIEATFWRSTRSARTPRILSVTSDGLIESDTMDRGRFGPGRFKLRDRRDIFSDDARMPCRNTQESERWTFGHCSVLFPRTEGVHGDAEGICELCFRQTDETT
ncbi:MAG: hypothetical protein OXQ31_15165 [Spirochaetaceae bacterium]|nr:hypothetical protein [Spirochaetaceae bacterium]